jgi:D-serine deaminase-like pyridoxal phosphate-dependent protein
VTPNGMRIADLETPALLVDLDVMERNLQRVADYTREHELRLRPHTKTHKSPSLGRKQLDLGAAGLTVAKVSEAEVMQNSGTPDLLVAYPVIGRKKLERLMQVAANTNITVSLDNLFAARQLSDAAQEAQREIGVLAEMDAGLGRVGVTPGPELIELARGIEKLPWLRYDGIAFYPGHIKPMEEGGLKDLEKLAQLVCTTLRKLKQAGLEPKIVSGGSTPALFHSHEIPGLNEIRPGTYIFNDRNTMLVGACTLEDCAASVLTTVVSTARKDQIIIDGGSKTFSSDRSAPSVELSCGHVVEAPDAVFTKMNEEHGYVELRSAKRDFAIGDRLRVIPNHVCVVMNLHETVYGVRGDRVEQTWKVEARGKLQ